MLFRNYEKPEGWSLGQPEVLVAHETIDVLGMPTVNYDSMGELVLSITQGKVPSIRIHSISDVVPALGYMMPYSSKLHVDAIASESQLIQDGGTVTVLAHEAQHISDFANRPVRSGLDLILSDALYVGRMASRVVFPELPPLKKRYEYSSVEKRAFAREKTAEVKAHEQDILFPCSTRTELLLRNRELTTSTITQLGLKRQVKFASDYVKPQRFFARLLSGQPKQV